MNRLATLVLVMGSLGACDDGRGPAAVVDDSALHAHPASESPVRTAVGQIRSIDANAGTLTLVLAQGRSRENTGRGPTLTLRATPAQLAAVKVDDVVEFKSRASQPYATLITVESHAHSDGGGPLGATEADGAAPPSHRVRLDSTAGVG
jgi:hypothetical protein